MQFSELVNPGGSRRARIEWVETVNDFSDARNDETRESRRTSHNMGRDVIAMP